MSQSLFRRTRQANFSSWRIRVVAPGYKTFTENLEDRTQDPLFHKEEPVPPPVVIRMKREFGPPEPEATP
jgi:hypothetical protein